MRFAIDFLGISFFSLLTLSPIIPQDSPKQFLYFKSLVWNRSISCHDITNMTCGVSNIFNLHTNRILRYVKSLSSFQTLELSPTQALLVFNIFYCRQRETEKEIYLRVNKETLNTELDSMVIRNCKCLNMIICSCIYRKIK